MALFGLFRKSSTEHEAARNLYDAAVKQARRPEFYRDLGVPDSLDGRFEMIVLHVFLVMHRLKSARSGVNDLSQALYDTLFSDMDRSLREMGAGDLGVAPRVKKMVQGFGGRVQAYDRALEQDDAALREAIARNIYGTVEADSRSLERMAAYVRAQVGALSRQDIARLSAGEVAFLDAPADQTSH
ncbi:MAG: ubiquinol-cytochrome C chaperone family protein [Rhodovibrionaceae bacterium]|nr:ubiquinol-cytochrome C chaperone family protein [Rhodovibrionaceae bacterium]